MKHFYGIVSELLVLNLILLFPYVGRANVLVLGAFCLCLLFIGVAESVDG